MRYNRPVIQITEKDILVFLKLQIRNVVLNSAVSNNNAANMKGIQSTPLKLFNSSEIILHGQIF